jgi:hypothetical protein
VLILNFNDAPCILARSLSAGYVFCLAQQLIPIATAHFHRVSH